MLVVQDRVYEGNCKNQIWGTWCVVRLSMQQRDLTCDLTHKNNSIAVCYV
ncbi:hypothetical protein T02_10865 [Trichinella nativa]|uniref:Uncharacterized protein n=1 Tax=Trichinella nativa TaxID=6335 RepID=A0A0V1KJM7_9BILA|nr:hypothetical protein T02_10865 [Trichinella nativa]